MTRQQQVWILFLIFCGLVVAMVMFRGLPGKSGTDADLPAPDSSVEKADPQEILARFEGEFAASELPMVRVQMIPADVGDPFISKSLGSFYLPKGEAPPKDVEGRPMILLAQINFSEVPPLEGYPDKGILQFFIAAYDDLMGLDLSGFDGEVKQDGYRVRYYPEPLEARDSSKLVSDFSFLPDPADRKVMVPVSKPCHLVFSSDTEQVTMSDYRFDKVFGDDFFPQFGGQEFEMMDEFWERSTASGHKVGGYAYFTQDDPRRGWSEPGPSAEEWLLLLQIDSDDAAGVMWGDVGVGNFFIRAEDLKQRDFSQVVYNWDCS